MLKFRIAGTSSHIRVDWAAMHQMVAFIAGPLYLSIYLAPSIPFLCFFQGISRRSINLRIKLSVTEFHDIRQQAIKNNNQAI